LLADKHQPAAPIPVIAVYIAGSLQTLLLWWLQQKMPHTPERMDEMFQQLVMPGVKAILFA
jgi:hypothetical protein